MLASWKAEHPTIQPIGGPIMDRGVIFFVLLVGIILLILLLVVLSSDDGAASSLRAWYPLLAA